MNNYKLTLFLGSAMAASLLSGCGGGSSGNSSGGSGSDSLSEPAPVTSKVGGKVIDGYVSGATVWLDINGNGVYDSTEPKTVSSSAGDYSLELTAAERECLPYASLYVDVPVGALDEDTGTVSEAYRMVLPPRLDPTVDTDLLNISPLTTVLADELNASLATWGNTLASCEELRSITGIRMDAEERLQEAIANMVARYNLSADRILADYIQRGDNESKRLALSIVTGLKAGFRYRDTVEKKYPNATYIRVEFFQGSDFDNGGAYPDAWYREVSVWLVDGFKSELVKMSDDLTREVRPIYLSDETSRDWNGGQLFLARDIYSYGGDDSPYICTNFETASITKGRISYALGNQSQSIESSDPATCINDRFGNGYYRYFFVNYFEGGISYSTRFTLTEGNPGFYALPDWVELQQKDKQLDFSELISYLGSLEYRFDADVNSANYYSWYKRSTDDTGNNRVQIDHFSTGAWERLSYQDDGTYVKTCSTDGVQWSDCL